MVEAAVVERFLSGCQAVMGETPDEGSLQRILSYLDLLERWNKTYNLTAIRKPDEMVSRHLLDSLSVLPWVNTSSLLDAGTGAGLPGVPLAIMRPHMQVTLLDSAGKKVRFLRHVKRQLKLENIDPRQERLEAYRPENAPQAIISRAFSSLQKFATASRHLLSADAKLLAMKGRYPENEISMLEDWIRVDSVEKLVLPGLQEQRHLVIMSVND
jgi:16S rRNA (guanine527-N7)-methyltransferase